MNKTLILQDIQVTARPNRILTDKCEFSKIFQKLYKIILAKTKLIFWTTKKQPVAPKGSDCLLLVGANAPQFEPFAKITQVEPANEKVETQNKKKGRPKTKSKATPPTIQKFSNHIEFIDYIPIHEIITYRHLFAHGFYVE